jgi:hypothetical protein
MPKVSAETRYPVVDIPRAKKKIGKTMTDFTFDVLREWITESTNVIPVWSGASRASFLKLANQAKVKIEIEPLIVAPIGSRIPLGYETSVGVIIADARGSRGLYGWDWASTLDYIGIVDDRVKFIQAGQRVVDRRKPPKLPQPPTTTTKKGGKK